MDLKNIFSSISDQIKIDYERISRNIPHFGERGEGREQILIELLKEYLPHRFGIDSGFVFDVHGNTSKQTDIIIYDKFIAPRFKISGEKYAYPCESVVAVGEVKTFLTKKELIDSIEKLIIIQRLDRTAGGKNKLRTGYHHKVNDTLFNPKLNESDSIWTFIFSSDSTSLPKLSENFINLCSAHARHLWPNMICILQKGILSYVSDKGLITDPRKAKYIYHSTDLEVKHALMKWFMLLCNHICDTNITTIDAISYFKAKQTQSIIYPLNNSDKT